MVAALAKGAKMQILSCSTAEQFGNCPDVIGNSGSHCWSHSDGFMNTTEVIPSEMQGNRSLEVRPLCREGVRQPREAANRHPHGQVLPFNMRRTNPALVRVSNEGCWDSTYNVSRGVPGLTIAGRGIDLDQLRVINPVDESVINCGGIGGKAVRRQLKAVRSSGLAKFLNEGFGGFSVPPSKMKGQDKLAIPFDSNKCVGVADVSSLRLMEPFVLLLLKDVTPNFVALNVIDRDVLNLAVQQTFALPADLGEQGQDCGVVDSSDSLGAIDGADFQEKLENL